MPGTRPRGNRQYDDEKQRHYEDVARRLGLMKVRFDIIVG